VDLLADAYVALCGIVFGCCVLCCGMLQYATICRAVSKLVFSFEPVICCVLLRFVALCWVVHPAVLDLIVVHVLCGSVISCCFLLLCSHEHFCALTSCCAVLCCAVLCCAAVYPYCWWLLTLSESPCHRIIICKLKSFAFPKERT